MKGLSGIKAVALVGSACVSALFPVTALVAAPHSDAALAGESAVLMGVAVAAPMQSAARQAIDREALRKNLQRLFDARMEGYSQVGPADNLSRIVRVVFDVGADGRATNIRIGKRSGSNLADRYSSSMVSRFTGLPGGERKRVCAVLQYGHVGQDPFEVAYLKAMKDETASAIADMHAERDGPQYNQHGRIIT